jgi:hypothetical protein
MEASLYLAKIALKRASLMLRKRLSSKLFYQALACLALSAAPCSFAAPVPQDPGPKLPSTDKPSHPATTQQPAATPAPAAKPAPKKHVFTNDDLRSSPDAAPMDFGQVNDCDNSCFEQVRQLAHVMPIPNSNWKRDVLQAIDQVRKDSEWQPFLRQLYDMRMKFCALGEAKQSELNNVANPRNVTPQELSIDEKYDVKFKQQQAALQALAPRQNELLRKFAGNPYSLQFANLQVSHLSNAPCTYQRPYPIQSDNDEDP